MSGNAAVDPLVPPEVDLRDFGFMPLDVRTLLSSSLWIKAKKDPRVAHAAVSLWCESWHQVPAASLPNDDEVLAELARCDAKEWARVRERALSHFVLCADGRLYHRTVAAKAIEAWQSKTKQRQRTAAATAARAGKRRGRDDDRDDKRDDDRHGPRDGGRDGGRDEHRDDERDESRDVHQGTGTGTGTTTPATSPPPPPASEREDGPLGEDPPPDDVVTTPTPAGRLGMAMREVGLHPSQISAQDPVALALLERGVAVEQFAEAVRDAMRKRAGDPWRYALTVLERRVAEAAEIAAGPAVAPDPMAWRKTFEGVQRRAAELGVKPRAGEMAADYERRVLTAHQRAASAAQGATA